MKNFDKIINAMKNDRINSEKQICQFIIDCGAVSSMTTAQKRLKLFKKRMYLCSSDHTNPMFLDIAKRELELNDEFLNIYELMYKFFCKGELIYFFFEPLRYCPYTGNTLNYALPTFTWQVPTLGMPFLAICISITKDSKPMSIHDFYKKLDEEFKLFIQAYNYSSSLSSKISNINFKLIQNTYDNWTELVLGKTYFSTLEDLYNEYTKDETQKTIIRKALYSITRILIADASCSCKISTYTTILLNHFKSNLTKFEKFELYPHKRAVTIPLEQEHYKYLSDNLKNPTTNFLNYIKSNHDEHSMDFMYNISIDNFDEFEKNTIIYFQNIEIGMDNIRRALDSWLHSYQNNPDIVLGLKCNRVIIDELKLNQHLKELNIVISRYHNKIIKYFNQYIKTVKKVSDPKKYKNHVINPDSFSNLEKDINTFLNSLYSKLVNELKTTNDILYISDPGIIYKSQYPPMSFYIEDIHRIFSIIFPNKNISEDCIVNYLYKNNYLYPLTCVDVKNLFLRFDE
ncbi:hypothetical protein [Faecalicatena contorta]|uniref:hypothetical protein n=1 Tax=Faecalicatena contorta TaxID=39482 RepID=UPI001F163F64|nr:hypothetical protein [Faecalicatena contorta]MCF2554406.1 hypothetical protein [Faecalicatena contorta]